MLLISLQTSISLPGTKKPSGWDIFLRLDLHTGKQSLYPVNLSQDQVKQLVQTQYGEQNALKRRKSLLIVHAVLLGEAYSYQPSLEP
jgi:3-deoxy-D-manno-octulosonic-acid transferase